MAKGRKPKSVEFMGLLGEILDLDTTALASRTGKTYGNMHRYLSGKQVPGKSVLRTALRHAFEWEVKALVEIRPTAEFAKRLPSTPGVYSLYDSSGSVIYVGQATNLKVEVGQALQREMNFPVRRGPKISQKQHPKYKEIATFLSAYEVPSPRMRHNLEAFLLRIFPNQSHNNKMGNFK